MVNKVKEIAQNKLAASRHVGEDEEKSPKIVDDSVSVGELVQALKLDRSAITRRVAVAIERGFLRNLEHRYRQPMRLVIADPMPDTATVLPLASALEAQK